MWAHGYSGIKGYKWAVLVSQNPQTQLSNFEDVIGFIELFMNWATSHLVSREELKVVVQNGRVLQIERGQKKGIY